MKTKLKELYDKRNRIDAAQKELLDKAEQEERVLTAEEEEQYDKMDEDFNSLDEEIRKLEAKIEDHTSRKAKLEARKEQMSQLKDEPVKPDPSESQDVQPQQTMSVRATEEYQEAFNTFLRYGVRSLEPAQLRALQADDDQIGGYLVAPEQFINELIRAVDDQVFMRKLSRVFPVTNADSVGAPALDADPDDADWTAEIKTGTEDDAMSFEKRDLRPHPLAKRIKVSKALIRKSLIPIEREVRNRLSYKFGISLEKAYLQGDGTNKPLGIFTASSDGISTGRDVSTDNTTTQIKADNLINCKYTLKSQYQRTAVWIFHRDAIKMIRKLKDGNGDYLWRAGLATDKPDTILERPYYISEYCPHTFTTGKYVGVLGDFRFYWIVDAMSMQIQVLTELYAETNQNGYIGRFETDGMPVLEEAFVRVTLA